MEGEDAPRFLQSQFSNDLRRQTSNPVSYGLFLDRKGRICADSFILQLEEQAFGLFSYFCAGEAIIEKLQANIIADDVELADRIAETSVISFWGEAVADFAHFAGLPLPEKGSFTAVGGGYLIHGRRSAQPNFDLIVESSASSSLKEWQEKLFAFEKQDSVASVSENALHYERLRSGIPAIPFDLDADNLPQEGGLEDDAVSFNKGCYLGQEVMARLQSMGQTRRKLYPVKLSCELPSLPCDLYDGERIAGHLRSAAGEEGGSIGLALLKKSALENARSFSLSPQGPGEVRLR